MICRFFLLVALFLTLVFSAGCAVFQPADARPGLNARERRALTESFTWVVAGRPVPTYSAKQLDALFRRSTDPSLDGERSEAHTARLAVALAVLGDEVFADALARQPEAVRRATAHRGLSLFWERYRLRYPRTQVLFERPA